MTVASVILARAGSKGVESKNSQLVGGLPLITRGIRAALTASLAGKVFVSTDSQDFAKIAKNSGAEVISRPSSLASDFSTSESALIHALSKISPRPEIIAFIQVTSPYISHQALNNAIFRVMNDELDVIFSASETYGFLWGKGPDGLATGINHDPGHRPRRQDREPHYMETGAFYVMRTEGFLKAKHRFFGRVGIEVVPEHSAIEIDTPEDLEIARVLARHFDAQVEALDVDTVIMDFDGVHTENSAFVSQDGTETVKVSRSDGFGIEQLKAAGKKMLIISKETNPVVTARAGKLGVEVLQGIENKKQALLDWADENQVALERSCYVGNDVNDIQCMELVGTSIAVADAEPEVLNIAKVVLNSRGGQGALRELSRMILNAGE